MRELTAGIVTLATYNGPVRGCDLSSPDRAETTAQTSEVLAEMVGESAGFVSVVEGQVPEDSEVDLCLRQS